MIAEAISKKIPVKQRQKVNYWDENKHYTFDEYFELEEKAPFKSEFHNGKINMMPNGTTDLGKVIGSLFFYLKLALKSMKIQTFVGTSEIKIFIKEIKTGLYPDIFVAVEPITYYKKNKAITNPTIIFEVLSDSTGNYDRGEKFRKYKHLPSFVEYVLIEQDQPVIDALHKKENGAWEMNTYMGLEDVLILTTLNVKIPLANIYEDVKIEQFRPINPICPCAS